MAESSGFLDLKDAPQLKSFLSSTSTFSASTTTKRPLGQILIDYIYKKAITLFISPAITCNQKKYLSLIFISLLKSLGTYTHFSKV